MDRLDVVKQKHLAQVKRDLADGGLNNDIKALINHIVEVSFHYGFDMGYAERDKGAEPEISEVVPEDVLIWNEIWLTRISDKPKEFSEWLSGQTLPYVENNPTPTDFAYYADYLRWKSNLPNID